MRNHEPEKSDPVGLHLLSNFGKIIADPGLRQQLTAYIPFTVGGGAVPMQSWPDRFCITAPIPFLIFKDFIPKRAYRYTR